MRYGEAGRPLAPGSIELLCSQRAVVLTCTPGANTAVVYEALYVSSARLALGRERQRAPAALSTSTLSLPRRVFFNIRRSSLLYSLCECFLLLGIIWKRSVQG